MQKILIKCNKKPARHLCSLADVSDTVSSETGMSAQFWIAFLAISLNFDNIPQKNAFSFK